MAGRPWPQFKLYAVPVAGTWMRAPAWWGRCAASARAGGGTTRSRRGPASSESGSPTIKAIRSALDGLAAGYCSPGEAGRRWFCCRWPEAHFRSSNDEGPMGPG